MMTAMGATEMHADKIETDAALVRRLLARQFPHWAGLPHTRWGKSSPMAPPDDSAVWHGQGRRPPAYQAAHGRH
jgi:hypothetical protein